MVTAGSTRRARRNHAQCAGASLKYKGRRRAASVSHQALQNHIRVRCFQRLRQAGSWQGMRQNAGEHVAAHCVANGVQELGLGDFCPDIINTSVRDALQTADLLLCHCAAEMQ